MKYSPSTRLINIIINAVLAAGFGFLGVWFAFLITPNLLTVQNSVVNIEIPEISVGLSVMLGSLGLAGMLVSLIGLAYSFMAFFRGGNDDLVRKTFSCYIALGYIVAFFFLLNATWLYRLTSSNLGDNDLGFIITVFVILAIIALIATNVPLLHMYGEGEHTNKIMHAITLAFVASDLAVALTFGVLCLANLGNLGTFAYSKDVLTKAGIFALIPLVAALLGLLALFGFARAERRNVVKKLNSFLFSGLVGVNGIAIIVTGLVGHLHYENGVKNISFMAKLYGASYTAQIEFSVMSYIVGGILVLLAFVLAYTTIVPPNKRIEQ